MAAEVLGGVLLNELLERLASRQVLAYFKGIPTAKLRKLQAELRSALLLLNDAEKRLIKERIVKEWVDDLTQTVYDADDLIYKINTEALRNQQKSSYITQVKALLPSSSKKAIKGKMDEIIAKLKHLRENNPNLLVVDKQALPERLPAPLVKESDVYGRDADKEAIVQMLLSDDADKEAIVQMLLSDDADSGANNLTVIPIVGMGGIGKTTLAQLVFDDERVKSNFKCKAWFTIGDGKVDCSEVMRRIIKEVSPEECKTEDSRVLQMKLREALMGKKFLFILDDFWDENQAKWDLLHTSLGSGLQGSKVIVTTRSTIVASNMKTRSTLYNLGVLSNDDGWLLFSKHALIDANSKEHSDLEVIGKEIVAKCEGLPLAIRSLAGLLRVNRNKERALNILNCGISEFYSSKMSNDILPALWFSYHYLPSDLKPCFSYCALFPKDYEFEKEEIILLWMAEGLLHSKSGKRIEDVGEEYFQDLISGSFFQPSANNTSAFVMHDLMHELAMFVSGGICLQKDNTNFSDCPDNIRHFSYQVERRHFSYMVEPDDPKKFEALSNVKGLRTFLRLPKFGPGLSRSLRMDHLLELLLRAGSCLRVLSVYETTKLPDSIGDFKYLKYLRLHGRGIVEVPEAVCNLHNLQILLLDCTIITRLPANIGNLINLRHLNFNRAPLTEMPLQIGKLKSLQTLTGFVLGESTGSHIKQLKELNELHGTLKISGLENVVHDQDVLVADLVNKKFLSELELYWYRSHSQVRTVVTALKPDELEKERKVLDALKPHANLKRLKIYKYQGTSFPNWVGDHLYSNLVKVTLSECYNSSSLPPLGQLSSLKHLKIKNLHSVVSISSEFYYSNADSPAARTKPFRSLERLDIKGMDNLQEWSFVEGEVEGGVFPCLKELNVVRCPSLKLSLPNYLPSLRKLDIFVCDRLEPLLPRAQSQQIDAAFPFLELLIIWDCRGQEFVLEGGLPSSLKQIHIVNCWNVTALEEEAFQRLTSLETLQVSDCPNLQSLPSRLPTSLSYLSVDDRRLLTPQILRERGEDWPHITDIPFLP